MIFKIYRTQNESFYDRIFVHFKLKFRNFIYILKELLMLLGRTADALMGRQINWVKNLPFFKDLSIKDFTTLLMNTW